MRDEEALSGAPIAAALHAYARSGALAFHTPGHKQGLGAHPLMKRLLTPEGLLSEVSLMEELDDLHEPTGCIKEAQEKAARLYGAGAAYFAINGTTGVIHAMLMAALAPGEVVLVPKNAHRSVVGALTLAGARPLYIEPLSDARLGIAHGVRPEAVEAALTAHAKIKAVLLVYPSYYGAAVDIGEIAAICHAHGALLLVDEAHGAHLPFSEALPSEAIAAGADLAAVSTHKTLGALTQCSMLLVREGAAVDAERVRESMSLLQSTSPNELLLASLDAARLQMEEEGEVTVGRAVRLAEGLRAEVNKIPGLFAPGREYFRKMGLSLDLTKVTVNVSGLGLTGAEAEHYLRWEQRIQCELSDARNVLFIISYADTEQETARLLAALKSLAAWARERAGAPAAAKREVSPGAREGTVTRPALTPREAFFARKERVSISEAAGRIAAEQVMFYPPGIPLLVPGERIEERTLAQVLAGLALGLKVVGPEDAELKTLKVIKEEASCPREN